LEFGAIYCKANALKSRTEKKKKNMVFAVVVDREHSFQHHLVVLYLTRAG